MHVLYENGSFIRANKSETLVRAMQVCAALNLQFPSQQMVKWLDSQTSDYDNTWEYWHPYHLFSDGSPYLKQWARGAYNYFGTMAAGGVMKNEYPLAYVIDPAVWSHGVYARVMACNPDPRTAGAASLMNEQTDPEQAWGDQIKELWLSVRRAQKDFTVVHEPAKIKRKIETLQALGERGFR